MDVSRAGWGSHGRSGLTWAKSPAVAPPAVRDEIPDAEDVEPPAPAVASTATFSKPTAVERAAGGELGGDAEISRGLSALRTVTDSQAAAAVQAPLGSAAGAAAGPVTGTGRALLDSVGEMWFVERRLYALDRTGHATAADWDDFAFDLQGISLAPGTYYFGPFAIGGSGYQANNLVKIDGSVSTGRGDIYPARVLTSLIPLLERGRGHLHSSHGIAIIVSSHILEETPSFDSDRLLQAVDRAKGHAHWALRAKLARAPRGGGREARFRASRFALDCGGSGRRPGDVGLPAVAPCGVDG